MKGRPYGVALILHLAAFVLPFVVPTSPDDGEDRENHQPGGEAVERGALREEGVGDEVRPVDGARPVVGVVDGERAPELKQAAAALPPVTEEVQEAEAAVQQKERRGERRR